MAALKEQSDCNSLVFCGNLDHKKGLKYLSECFPYFTILKRGIKKSLLRSLYAVVAPGNISRMLTGNSLFSILYIKIAMFCNLEFSIVVICALLKSSP